MLPGVLGLEALQRLIQGKEIVAGGVRSYREVLDIDGSAATTALEPTFRPGALDQDITHRPTGREEEVSAALPSLVFATDQTQEGLVHQGGRLQRVIGSLGFEMSRSKMPHVVV